MATSSSSKCCKLFTSTTYDVYCSNTAIVVILLGVTVTLVSYFYPVEWDFQVDPKQSAQENEDRLARQTDTQNAVYIMSVTGAALVTVGGIISSFLLTKYIILQECAETDEDEEALTIPSFPSLCETGTAEAADWRNMDRTPAGKAENKDTTATALRNGQQQQQKQQQQQQRTFVDSDYLQLGAGARCQQYGSTE